MLTQVAVNSFGFLIFTYLLWKRLNEDYSNQQIFTTAFYALIGGTVFYFVSSKLFFSYWFWFTLSGILLAILVAILRFKLRVYETIEASVGGFLVWLGLIFLTDSVVRSSLYSFIGFAVMTSLTGLFYFLHNHYRNFSWYRSGRIGFSGLTTIGIFFLLRAISAVIYPTALTFSGNLEIYISGIASFIFFLLTYNLSRIKV